MSVLEERVWEKNQTSNLRFKNIFKPNKIIKKILFFHFLVIYCLESNHMNMLEEEENIYKDILFQ